MHFISCSTDLLLPLELLKQHLLLPSLFLVSLVLQFVSERAAEQLGEGRLLAVLEVLVGNLVEGVVPGVEGHEGFEVVEASDLGALE